MTDENARSGFVPSSLRTERAPPVSRRLWILGFDKDRMDRAREVIEAAGHKVRTGEPGGELGNTIKDFRPDVIIVDMKDHPERGRHAATQLRADRATRQLPIILVSVSGEERTKADKAVTGPTRRYVLPLDTPTVLGAILADL